MPWSGTFATPGALMHPRQVKELQAMIGKLFGAWLGEKVAGKN